MLRFVRDSTSEVVAYVLSTEGESYYVEKVRDAVARETYRTHVQASLDPAVLEKFAGIYELDPTFGGPDNKLLLIIRHEGLKLFAAAAGAPEVLLLPFTSTVFRHDVDDFSIEFLVNDSGAVDECILQFDNQSIRARRHP
jgi:hypothetical protein